MTLFYLVRTKETHNVKNTCSTNICLGMTISRDKSQTLQTVTKRDIWFIKEPVNKLGENSIPTVDPDEVFSI